jgi:hypothetical protein
MFYSKHYIDSVVIRSGININKKDILILVADDILQSITLTSVNHDK